jgi:hypothetical protein
MVIQFTSQLAGKYKGYSKEDADIYRKRQIVVFTECYHLPRHKNKRTGYAPLPFILPHREEKDQEIGRQFVFPSIISPPSLV